MKRIRLLLSASVAALVLAACGTSIAPLEGSNDRDPNPDGVVSFEVSPRSIRDGSVGDQYTFTMTARGVPADVRIVTFAWTITGATPSSASVRVSDGVATHSVNHGFDEAGTYAFMASVTKPTHPTDPMAGELLAATRAIIAIDADPVRELELGTCDGWVNSESGGYGVTIDDWDLSGVPDGALIDIKWDTIGIPDSFIVDYPEDVLVFESGFVGHARYDGDQMYPGGVVGGPVGGADGIFVKDSAVGDTFVVTVLGPNPRTLWSYEIRCRVPGN